MQIKTLSTKLDISGFVIERTSKRMKHRFQELLKYHKIGVTVDQWVVLYAIFNSDKTSQHEIGQKVFKDAPTLTRILDLLDKKSLIIRETNPDDRRQFKIKLTQNGKNKVKEIIPLTKIFRQTAWENLTDEEISKMELVLNKIFINLQKPVI